MSQTGKLCICSAHTLHIMNTMAAYCLLRHPLNLRHRDPVLACVVSSNADNSWHILWAETLFQAWNHGYPWRWNLGIMGHYPLEHVCLNVVRFEKHELGVYALLPTWGPHWCTVYSAVSHLLQPLELQVLCWGNLLCLLDLITFQTKVALKSLHH